ncbi:MAG: hypothetical protein IKO46_03755 [Salinivirgaceae bacterium]|nr:hypothetical protein [Salinivirgaceae bacterium]
MFKNNKKVCKNFLIAIIAIESVAFIILLMLELCNIKETSTLLGLSMAFIGILLTVILCQITTEKINGLEAKIDEFISKNNKQ